MFAHQKNRVVALPASVRLHQVPAPPNIAAPEGWLPGHEIHSTQPTTKILIFKVAADAASSGNLGPTSPARRAPSAARSGAPS